MADVSRRGMEKSGVLFLHFIIDWVIILCVTEKLVIAELTAISVWFCSYLLMFYERRGKI